MFIIINYVYDTLYTIKKNIMPLGITKPPHPYPAPSSTQGKWLSELHLILTHSAESQGKPK